MADIDNLLASGSAATAEPSQRGFRSWKERSALTANDPDAGAADGVATAGCDLRRRVRFLWWCSSVVAVVGFVLLLAVKPSTAGQAVYTSPRSPSDTRAWSSGRHGFPRILSRSSMELGHRG
jgi:hypothetical protein